MSAESLAHAVIVQLYSFIVDELDPDPAPIEHYLTGAEAQQLAARVVGPLNRPEPEPIVLDFDPDDIDPGDTDP